MPQPEPHPPASLPELLPEPLLDVLPEPPLDVLPELPLDVLPVPLELPPAPSTDASTFPPDTVEPPQRALRTATTPIAAKPKTLLDERMTARSARDVPLEDPPSTRRNAIGSLTGVCRPRHHDQALVLEVPAEARR